MLEILDKGGGYLGLGARAKLAITHKSAGTKIVASVGQQSSSSAAIHTSSRAPALLQFIRPAELQLCCNSYVQQSSSSAAIHISRQAPNLPRIGAERELRTPGIAVCMLGVILNTPTLQEHYLCSISNRNKVIWSGTCG